jgi:hypothetical protein
MNLKVSVKEKKDINKRSVSDAIAREIIKAVSSLDYGSVVIKVHDAKVVQIEVTERKRFDQIWNLEKGGGI